MVIRIIPITGYQPGEKISTTGEGAPGVRDPPQENSTGAQPTRITLRL